MGAKTHPLLRRLEQVCAQADAEFERARNLHGARIKCASGCSSCCSQIFQITEVEAARVSRFVAGLPQPQQERMLSRATENLRKREWLFGGNEQWGDTLEGGGLPCPALTENGACGIYEARPILCRKFGVPIYNPDKPGQVMACELNFAPGDAIEDDQLVTKQTSLYESQLALQSEWNNQGGARDSKPWSVARAIAEPAADMLDELS